MGKISPMRAAESPDASIVWLSPADVCALLPTVTIDILAARRRMRQDPPFYKPTGASGNVVLYDRAEVIAWVRGSRVETRPEAVAS